MEWTSEKVVALIEMYRERPVLWDSKNATYKNRNKRNDALMEISVLIGESKDEIIRKIKNLQSHFARELKKEKDSMRSGSETDAIYKSSWFAYRNMLFLKDKNKPRLTTNTESEITDGESQTVITNDAPEETVSQQQEHPEITNVDNNSNTIKKPPPAIKNIPTRKRKVDSQTSEAYAIMKEVYAGRSQRDEFTVFGEQVGMKVRNLPTDHAKIVVQHIINTTLFEAQLGKYNNPVASTPWNSMQPFSSEHHLQYSQPPSQLLRENHYCSTQPTSSSSSSYTPLCSPSPRSQTTISQPPTPLQTEPPSTLEGIYSNEVDDNMYSQNDLGY